MSERAPRIETIEPQPTIAIRRVVPMADLDLGQVYAAAFPLLFAALGEHGLSPAGPPYGRYHEWGERVDVEIGVPVAAPIAGLPRAPVDGDVFASELPGGRVAALTHVGPYDGLAVAIARLVRWVDEQGLERRPGPWESYRGDPESTPSEELQTDIVQPIASPPG